MNHYYCLYDYLDGQDLVDHLQKFGRMREREARFIFRQILSAVGKIRYKAVLICFVF